MSHPHFPEYEYRNTRRVVYEQSGATFVLVCPVCGRYVMADDTITLRGEGYVNESDPNATCSKDGRVCMVFEGYL